MNAKDVRSTSSFPPHTHTHTQTLSPAHDIQCMIYRLRTSAQRIWAVRRNGSSEFVVPGRPFRRRRACESEFCSNIDADAVPVHIHINVHVHVHTSACAHRVMLTVSATPCAHRWAALCRDSRVVSAYIFPNGTSSPVCMLPCSPMLSKCVCVFVYAPFDSIIRASASP